MGGRTTISLAGALAVALIIAAPAPGATIEVTTTNDELDGAPDATCSLREAVESANDNFAIGGCPKGQASKVDAIELDAGDYELDIPTTDDALNANGDLDIGSGGDVTIRGIGSDETSIVTILDDRIIEYGGFDQVLTLERLEVSGGFAADNTPDSGGNLHIAAGTLKMKSARSSNSFAAVGGAIALENGAGGQLKGTTVTGAGAETDGGAVVVRNGGKLTVKKSVFDNNEVEESGDLQGGAIRTFAGRLVISDSSFIGNTIETNGPGTDGAGGAIYAGDLIDVKRTLFTGNSAFAGVAGDATGGAIHYLDIGDSKISNSTFFDNDTGGDGGAIYTNGGTLAVSHSSFLSNDATEGGNIFQANLGAVTLQSSVLATPLVGSSCAALAEVESKGYNVFDTEDPTCPLTGKDELVDDVKFDSTTPEDNGGPTLTLGLKKSSKAVDLVPVKKCGKTDQRGFDRPKGPKCDAGAVERGAKP